MEIRKAVQEDIPLLIPMYEKMYAALESFGLPFKLDPDELESVLNVTIKSKLCCLAVAIEDGKGIGYVQASIAKLDRKLTNEGEKSIGIINDVYTDDASRARGVATALCQYAEQWLQECGINLCQAQVLCQNAPARSFWSGRGYDDLHVTVSKRLN